MTTLQPQGLRRADYLEKSGTLAVVQPEATPGASLDEAITASIAPFVIVTAAGEVTAFNGHVDLGTGIRTALAQIVAEELDVSFARVAMVPRSAVAPDQGPTIASETIQLSAIPLRCAAAQARRFLVDRAAAIFGIPAEALTVEDGVVRPLADDNRRLSYGELIGGERVRLALAEDVPVKAPGAYRIVGSSQPRVDLPAKATGSLVFVHDMRLPGMLHGRVVRPPYAASIRAITSDSLIRVDEASVAHLPGVVAVVVVGDFVGVVAEREEQAEAAMRALKVEWREGAQPPISADICRRIDAQPVAAAMLLDKGDVEAALKSAARQITRSYVWPYQLHGSIGPSAALAEVADGKARVWSGSQNPLWLRRDLALLLDLA